jgi:Flp pilus assembly protein TadD
METAEKQPARPRRKSAHLQAALIALWLAATAAVIALALAKVPPLDRMRRDFLASAYAAEARQAAFSLPMHRRKALNAARRVVALAPDNPSTTAMMTEVFLRTEAWSDALATLLRDGKPTPQSSPEQLGMCYLMTGRTEEGSVLLEEAVRTAHDVRHRDPQSPAEYAHALNDVGYFYALAGVHLDRARQYTSQAVELEPLESAFLDSLGWAYLRSGDFEQACFYLERAVRLELPQRDPELEYHLGTCYARRGRLAEAARELQHALELDPDHPQAAEELRRLQWDLPHPAMASLR